MNNDADPFSTISTSTRSLARMRDTARELRCATGANVRASIHPTDIMGETIQITQRGHRLAMAPFFIATIPSFRRTARRAGVISLRSNHERT